MEGEEGAVLRSGEGELTERQGYTRERMLPPYKPLADAGALQGEALMNSLLETQHDFAVCISKFPYTLHILDIALMLLFSPAP